MKRLQIYIDEDLDEALAAEASRTGTSKAALIRRYVREQVKPFPAPGDDPLAELIGAVDCEPGDVDEVVYGT